jgi:hypothetical protein
MNRKNAFKEAKIDDPTEYIDWRPIGTVAKEAPDLAPKHLARIRAPMTLSPILLLGRAWKDNRTYATSRLKMKFQALQIW